MGLPCSQPHCPVHLLSPPPSLSGCLSSSLSSRLLTSLKSAKITIRSVRLWSTSRSTSTAMANFFTQVDQALPGFARYFKRASTAVNHHGVNMMEYQVKRGGKVVLQDISKPTRMEWGTPVEAMTAVLELEKTVTQTLQDLQAVAAEKKDFH